MKFQNGTFNVKQEMIDYFPIFKEQDQDEVYAMEMEYEDFLQVYFYHKNEKSSWKHSNIL